MLCERFTEKSLVSEYNQYNWYYLFYARLCWEDIALSSACLSVCLLRTYGCYVLCYAMY